MQRFSVLFLCLLFLSSPLFSQKKELKTKFGKLSDKEIAMTSYDADPAAPAVVLFDKGEVSHRYDDNNGFSIVFQRHTRVKIFKKDALDMADIIIGHYKDAKIGDIKASCFNLENGKMVETKLEKENIFEETVTKNFNLTKFVIPAAKEGSILDYTVTLSATGAIAMPQSWNFQRKRVPTIWSEFEASVPGFIEFKKMSQGWTPFSLAEEGQTDERLSIMLKDSGEGLGSSTKFENVNLVYTSNKMHFIQENVPALKPEEYVNSTNDYLSSLNFDIRTVYKTDFINVGTSYKLVNGLPTAYNRTWKGMGKDLLEDIYDKDMKAVRSLEDAAKGCVAGKSELNEKIAAVYEYIGTNYQVKDGYDRIFKSQSMDDLVKNRKGTPTDLNLLYLNMLHKVGLKAWPVLISTTDNGRVQPFRVSTDEFNRLIAGVQLEDSTMLLVDVSAFPNPVGLLSEDDLNNSGLLLQSEDDIKWVPIQNKVSVKTAVIANLSLKSDGQVGGSVVCYESGYNGVEGRKSIKEKGELSTVKEMFKDWVVDGEITDLKVGNAANWNEASLKMEFNLNTAAFTNVAGDKVYFSPLTGLGRHDNPFKNPERKFNVDLGPIKEVSYNMSFTIPSGYKVESMPKPTKFVFGDNALSFEYITETKGDALKFNVKLKQKTDFVAATDYTELQQFFGSMTTKMDEQVVLSKI